MPVRYFQYYPEMRYGDYILKDITKLSRLTDDLDISGLTFLPYTVKEEQTAADVANFYYGDVSYVWLVYLANDMVDPYNDWPMTQNQLEGYIADQYLYACALCVLRREPETMELVSPHIGATADMMLAIARGLPPTTFSFLQPTSDDYDACYLEIWNWLKNNNNADAPTAISDEYNVENYTALLETLQELIDNDFAADGTTARQGLYDLLLQSTNLRPHWDINNNGVLDETTLANAKSYATGEYDNMSLLVQGKVNGGMQNLITAWRTAGLTLTDEAPLVRLGRPISYTYMYDYLVSEIPEGLAEIILSIPSKVDLQKTLNVLEWTKDTTITRNIIHYANVDNPELVISADTYALNSPVSSKTWNEFVPSEWQPVRVYDFEFLNNEEKRSIQLISNTEAGAIESRLKGIMK